MNYSDKFLKEETAISPVISTILMIAMVVILAALIATYAFDDVNVVTDVPQASLRAINQSTDGFTLEHQGGDEINLNNTRLLVAGKDVSINGSIKSGETIFINTTLAIGDQVKFIDVSSQQVIAEFTARY
ncbi:MAG: type IV pilin N-terminal domain-containing protein [Methanosarcinaceae archaeon]|nr:type IV pilin N-terminal domain-containing protein [Methanosarcinaceae archaeon]